MFDGIKSGFFNSKKKTSKEDVNELKPEEEVCMDTTDYTADYVDLTNDEATDLLEKPRLRCIVIAGDVNTSAIARDFQFVEHDGTKPTELFAKHHSLQTLLIDHLPQDVQVAAELVKNFDVEAVVVTANKEDQTNPVLTFFADLDILRTVYKSNDTEASVKLVLSNPQLNIIDVE